jgi:rSAM/selenodomain-associated transferase 1
MSKEALIIFVKNPILGQVKTRLAATIGNQKALEIYLQLQGRTHAVTNPLGQDKWLFYSNEVDTDDIWDKDQYHKQVQISGDLGDKMHHAFQHCFDQGYEKVCIIGSDLMDITTSIIEHAFESLETHDTVVGPAIDGGYYLLGMKTLHAAVFTNKDWSTDSVLRKTLTDFRHNNLSCHSLASRNDIDTEEDWNEFLSGQ